MTSTVPLKLLPGTSPVKEMAYSGWPPSRATRAFSFPDLTVMLEREIHGLRTMTVAVVAETAPTRTSWGPLGTT